MKNILLTLVMMMTLLISIGSASAQSSPEWIKDLKQSKTADQIFVVAGVGQTTAWISMHEKDSNGNWNQIMTTPGFIGKYGLGKTREGDSKTPVGIFHFNRAFGIAPDPGCNAFDYLQVDENHYWSGDSRKGMRYNQMVDIREFPDLNREDSEHIVDYDPHYTYALNISYNEKGKAGKGSAIFLHCFSDIKPYTGGCVAIPIDKMRFVMQNVKADCVVVIDSLKNLSTETYEEWGL